MSSRSSHTESHNAQPFGYSDLEKAWDNGYIAIETWTLPSGNVPILTLTPASEFIQLLADGRSPGLLVDKLTAGVRNSVATEGDHLHEDLGCAIFYALTGHPEKAMDWWLSVGIVRQLLVLPPGSIRDQIHARVHPSWSSQYGRRFDPGTGTVEPHYDA